MAGRMEGKVAFITGAARGQGRSHAVRLAEEGADIIAVDICETIPQLEGYYPGTTEDDLAETVKLVEKTGRRIVAEKADVRDIARLEQVVKQGVATLGGRLDAIIANAGIAIGNHWHGYSQDEWQVTIDINLTGVWNTVRASAPAMVDAGNGGSIVLVSSTNGMKAGPFAAPYNASKAGVTALAKTFAMELADHGIRANSIHPGPVDTPLGNRAGGGIQELDAENPGLLAMYSNWKKGNPAFMDPLEISNAILYLVSDESTWTTGLAMAVDGGTTVY
ncbi:mycofactocin-coupled SDR family oxidoreductase [Rhodococcus koreensis]|uniref:SDR family mycofactocin-dependent oxidoreductase n=1 Tax=Rhodococcus koreensis TaxID=99653 RepID=A0A1H4KY81_9NOCA|nr:mycofactocin-coupled SDR family oxidoreductase [Rhodococcus koreensis]SEB63078.1 SDR family mycofactocin-dependent oxidoreductase [Rhodococcus koreensis]